ncbi:metal-dependent transcriptional regulator [Brevibacterium sp. 50QC2O2]|uniref:metal-dependent transcriptional regulator n=1 Tax=Brevibacterium TaxID=1696 RepID=UPI00211CF93C|nr:MULTISPECIES: metal-dependent transcriptional regulator [unclassified Brevibacterium]MCQ9366653.1 metal-dependent transcriptional regulator [Brevibacterium sp. 91QC2O2]MCQ9384370.1 metal-dependent transcriptional regulator [Brevibacterium sp. 68QC2CO]MCQ9389607.1 metal-dependent transcriptional regulator [Brevibacterium sp. 50QC2O2]
MSTPMNSRLVEDYTSIIWKAHELPGQGPSTGDLAEQLGVTAPTVSANLKKLSRDGFIDYRPYGAITLTPAGTQIAIGVVRRHRILETYLVRALGLTWDQVHEEAHRLEHALSDLVLAKMDAALGHPSHDPHGDPIPTADGTVAVDSSIPLLDVAQEVTVRVARVSDRSDELLRYLAGHGLQVGTELTLVSANPIAGTVSVRIDDRSVELGLSAADAVRVLPVHPHQGDGA